MPSITERLIAAHQAGAAEKRALDTHAQEQETHKLTVQAHKLALDNAKLEQALHLRQIQGMTSGGPTGQATTETPTIQPPPSAPDAITPPQASPDLNEGIQGLLMKIRSQPVAAQPMPIQGMSQSVETGTPPALPDIQTGVAGFPSIPGTNLELEKAKQMSDLLQAMKLERLKPFNVAEGAMNVQPSLTGGPAQVFENPKPTPNVDPNSPSVLAAKNKFAEDLAKAQRIFTEKENEKNRDAALGRARLQAAARLSASGLPPATATRVGIIAQGFDNSPIVKNYNETQNRISTTEGILAGNRTGPGDLAQVFEFMKGLDPTSVVRESEYATAAKSGNLFAGWAAKFNGYLKPEGGFLPENVRQEFMNLLKQKLAASQKQVDNLRTEQAAKINKWTGKTDGAEYLTDFTGGALNATSATPSLDFDGHRFPDQKALDEYKRLTNQ